MHIGLIGGRRCRNTCLRRATGSGMDARPEITIVHAQVQDPASNNVADNREQQADIYAVLINRLKAAGCDCAAITSLGGHFCYKETLQRASPSLVSADTPPDDYFVSLGLPTVGLLARTIHKGFITGA